MKYFTKFFGLGCMALVAMLLTAPGAFSQTTTYYVDTVNGVASGNCSDADATNPPCTLARALTQASAGGEIAVRVRRAGGSVTISDDEVDLAAQTYTFSAYQRGGAAGARVKATLNFTGEVKITGGGQDGMFLRHKDLTVQFKDVVTFNNNDPFGSNVAMQGPFMISGTLATGAATYGNLVVTSDVTIKGISAADGAAIAAGAAAPIIVVDALEIKSGATLTIGTKGNETDANANHRIDLRVPLKKLAAARAMDAKGADMGNLIVNGTIDGEGELWIAHESPSEVRSTNDNPPVHNFHMPGDYMPDAMGKVDYEDCVMISGSGRILVKTTAVAAGNVCVTLSEMGDLIVAGSIEGTGVIPTTDIIFRNPVMIDGSVHQWGDARVVFEKKAMVDGGVVLNNGTVPVDVVPPAVFGTVASGTVADVGDDAADAHYARTVTLKTAGKAATDAVPAVPDDPNTDEDESMPEIPAMPAMAPEYYSCTGEMSEMSRRSAAAIVFSGVQFMADGNMIEGDLSLRYTTNTVRNQGDALTTVEEGFEHLEICETQAIFWAPAVGKADDHDMSTVGGDLSIEAGGTVRLDGVKAGTDAKPIYSAHNLNVDGDIFVDGPMGGSITMGSPAMSSIKGECGKDDLMLGGGNRVTLTSMNDHVVSVGSGGVTIDALVLQQKLDIQGSGNLTSSTVHVGAGGELVSNGKAKVTSDLILQGKGLSGALATGSTVTNLVYASTRGEISLSNLDVLSVSSGRGLRVENPLTVNTLGLCSGEVTLVDTGNDKTNSLTVNTAIHVKDGKITMDTNAPGDLVGDGGEKAAAGDGYILRYVTEGERTVGAELMGARDLVIDHKMAKLTVSDDLSLRGKLHIVNGSLSVMGDLTVGASNLAADRFVNIHAGAELNSNGNNVVTHAMVTVDGKLMTGDGDLHVLGNNHPTSKYYNTETAMAVVGAKGVIDVGMGTLQLGPVYSEPHNGLADGARPDVSLTVAKGGMVKGMIDVPKGSKETSITGEAFDVIVLDGTGNPKKDAKGADNWGGGLFFHDTKVVIDSLAAMNDAAVEFYDDVNPTAEGDSITIKKDVVLKSARIYVNQNNTLKFGGDLTISDTGGITVWNNAKVTVDGDFVQDEGKKHAGNEDGTKLPHDAVFTVMGDFMVADSASRYESGAGAKLVLKGDFSFGAVKMGSKKMLNAMLEFSGKKSQSVMSSVHLGDVVVNNSMGLTLGSDVMQGKMNTLTLTRGVISSMDDASGKDDDMMHTWTVSNTGIEEDVRGRNNAFENCDMSTEMCDSVIKKGSRSSHVAAGISRLVMHGNSGGGETSGGYLFPVGGMDGDMAYYRPLILQLPDDLSDADTVTVSPEMVPEGAMPAWPAENILVPVQGGLLTLDAHADIFWKVELKEAMDQNPHIRVAAGGLANVFDPDGIRLVQWDCDWSNPRLAGTAIVGEDEESFAENGYVNGVLNLTQMSVEVGTCAILGVAANGLENPIHMDALTGGLSRVQFIHNVPLPAPVDLSLDGVRLQSGLEFRNATGYAVVAAGAHSASIQVAGAPADQAITFDLPTLAHERSYAVIAHGAATAPMVEILETRMTSLADNMVDAILVHGSADLGEVDVRTVDMTSDHAATMVLANNIKFGEATNYLALEPGLHNIQVKSAQGEEEIDVFEVSLNGYEGETVILNLSGTKNVMAIGFEIFGVDIRGDRISTQTVTSVVDEIAELPTEFALHGNYPNPFNPSTRIQFDLPESAQVTLQVVDMLGREVMTLPAKEFEAGANRNMEINAVNLASGTYLYRMIATGAESRYVKTGRMTLVK